MGALRVSGNGNKKRQVSGQTERGRRQREREMMGVEDLSAGDEELCSENVLEPITLVRVGSGQDYRG